MIRFHSKTRNQLSLRGFRRFPEWAFIAISRFETLRASSPQADFMPLCNGVIFSPFLYLVFPLLSLRSLAWCFFFCIRREQSRALQEHCRIISMVSIIKFAHEYIACRIYWKYWFEPATRNIRYSNKLTTNCTTTYVRSRAGCLFSILRKKSH